MPCFAKESPLQEKVLYQRLYIWGRGIIQVSVLPPAFLSHPQGEVKTESLLKGTGEGLRLTKRPLAFSEHLTIISVGHQYNNSGFELKEV